MRLDLSKARDTVETETPHSRATSFSVTMMEHTFQGHYGATQGKLMICTKNKKQFWQ
jgi:hypothetical protein